MIRFISLFSTTIFLLFSFGTASHAKSTKYAQLFVFGGSMADVGNEGLVSSETMPISPPYYYGRFSNGPLWVEYLALALGTPAIEPSLAGGADFAFGGALSGTTLVSTAGPKDLPAQLDDFGRSGFSLTPQALVLIDIGTNDLAALAHASDELSQTQEAETVSQVVANEIAFIDQIAQRGAQTVVVLNVGDLKKAPAYQSVNGAAQAALSAAVVAFNAQLSADLPVTAERDGITIVQIDLFALTDAIVDAPAVYGFNDVTDACWTGRADSTAGGTLCGKTTTAQDTHLFWDSLHLTTAGHGIVASAALSILPAAP